MSKWFEGEWAMALVTLAVCIPIVGALAYLFAWSVTLRDVIYVAVGCALGALWRVLVNWWRSRVATSAQSVD